MGVAELIAIDFSSPNPISVLAPGTPLLHAGPATHQTAAAPANGGAALCSLCNATANR